MREEANASGGGKIINKTTKLMYRNYEYRSTTPPLGGWGAN